MSANFNQTRNFVQRHLAQRSPKELRARLAPKGIPPGPRVPGGTASTPERLAARWQIIRATPEARATLADADSVARSELFGRNTENFIGTVKVPVGLAGPLRVNGLFAAGA